VSAEIVAVTRAVPAAPSVIDRAAELLLSGWQPERMWFAPSGLPVSGEEAARHLEAVLDLLERKGWQRELDTDEGLDDPGDLDESAPVPHMLRHLIRMLTSVIRYEYFSAPAGLVLWQAMGRVGPDVKSVSGRCLDLVLRAHTGAPSANHGLWSGREGRTFDEVRDLLVTGAAFAREYGPGAA